MTEWIIYGNAYTYGNSSPHNSSVSQKFVLDVNSKINIVIFFNIMWNIDMVNKTISSITVNYYNNVKILEDLNKYVFKLNNYTPLYLSTVDTYYDYTQYQCSIPS